MGHVLEIRDLVVTTGGRTVLHGISCAAPAGCLIGVLGPRGSGKSTLLRAVVGAQEIHAGQVRVLDAPAGTPALRHRVGYAPAATSTYPDLTVLGNARYFASLWSLSRRAADQALAAVELSEHADRLAGALPIPLRARLSLACALVSAPQVLVLDEPGEGLDPVSRCDLLARLGALAVRGTTVIVAGDDLDDATRCDRVLLLHGGRVIGDGTPDELLHRTGTTHPEEAFVRLCGTPSPRPADRTPVEVA
ncbi:ABC transporter ATP-binding protein [Pseudonocardia spinosispora]|uniref:ABC transporter ATP-binding protein n=1 Tax=Pseudonocardia spinosispora TaxID=103441 RepID=UPI00041374D0|nr:ABC transporter ATP-binding protein [Pseudonocardia spinosispora]